MKSTLVRLTIIAGFVALLTFATTISNRGFTSRAIVFNGTSQYARVTLPNSAPWTSLGAFKIMGRLRGMSSGSGYITSVGIPDVSHPFDLFQSGGGDPKRIDAYDNRAGTQDYHAPNTFTDVVFKLQYDPANSRWTLESWKADGTGYVVTTETISTTTNWNLGGHYLTLAANPYGVGLSDAHVDWWCWQQGADALGSGNFPGAEVPTGTFLVKYTFDNDDGADSSGNGLNLTLTSSPTFETTPGGSGGDTTPPTISGISASPSSSSAVITWSTNELATSRVFFDTVSHTSDTDGSQYAQSSASDSTADNTSHSITLSSLASSTTYFYKIRSADAAGNAAFSTQQSFTTSSQSTPTFVRLITANVQHGVGTDGATNYTRQTNILTRDTDIVCLQERTTGDTGWNASMSAAGFTEAAYAENDPSQQDGPSIWVRTSTVTVHQPTYSHDLSSGAIGWDGSTNVDKAAVAVKVTVAGRQFYVVNTHLCWSACADAQNSEFSTTRVNQINELLNWINTTLTGGLDILIVGDMNFGPAYAKTSTSTPTGITTQRGIFLVDYDDLWEKGINTGKATALWPDRNSNGVLDMPLTVLDSSGGNNNTRTHDLRRIDYFFLKKTASTLALHNIDVPDLRAGCSGVASDQMWGTADDLGVRPSDHNWVKLTLLLN
jgi:endonuclease/exonuclease/phosphatase family metal-dependent hydrolase